MGLSYAPVLDDDPEAAAVYGAFSYWCGEAGSSARLTQSVARKCSLTEFAPNTVLYVEYWAGQNRVPIRDGEAVPGYISADYGKGPELKTISFAGPGAAPTLDSVRQVGAYVFLSGLGDEAAKTRRSVLLERSVHEGRMNLAFADGHVEALPLVEITCRSPKDIPIWTRAWD